VPPIEWCNEAWVEKKFGVPVNKLVDLLGLMGDSIDNIPGAPGLAPRARLKSFRTLARLKTRSFTEKTSRTNDIANLCVTMPN
jgi:5'-3' exonuclease